jgi:hypothetical protein
MSFVFSCHQRRYYGQTSDELVAEWNQDHPDDPVTETAQPPFHELTPPGSMFKPPAGS